jgi:hypothetical protein
MTETLKYPAGEWTHADFAEINGKTKPSVYNQLQAAIKNGTVVKTEKRSSGKGKPSQYYKLADATATVVIPTVTVKVDPTDIVAVPVDSVPKVTMPQNEPAPTVESVIPSETPVEINPEPIVVADVTPVSKSEPATELAPGTHSIDHVCPVCKKNLLAWKDSTGIMVKCLQPAEVCKSTENPFGHGKNEKEACEVLNQKWGYALKGSN